MPRVPGVVTPARQAAGGSASEPNPTTRWVLGIAVLVVVGALVAYIALRSSRGPSRDDRFAAVGGAPGSGTAQPAGTSRPAKGAILLQELAEPWSSKTFQFRSLTGSPVSALIIRLPAKASDQTQSYWAFSLTEAYGSCPLELAEPWSSKTFQFRSLTGSPVSALIIRLPAKASDQTQSYWAFSLTEAYGSCPLEYITDLNRLSSEYGFEAKHPMVANPCKRALYDPLQMASMPTGAWARGAIVHGSALRPPMAIDIRIEGGQIIPVQME